MFRLELGFVCVGIMILLATAFVVTCIVRKMRVTPTSFWVLALGLCLAAAPLAVLGYENAVLVCLTLACVAFFAGFVATIRKK